LIMPSFFCAKKWMRPFLTGRTKFFTLVVVLLSLTLIGSAQETTGGIQGTVKDPSGAVVPQAVVRVDTPTLPGGKTAISDGKGYYHFTNLPPGTYTITVTATGFASRKQEGLVLEVGHLPTIDLVVTVGSESTVVEVAAENPAIDVTTVTTLTNVTQDVINYVPRGVSYQSVIQFAPSARNEPLMGNNTLSNGTGGSSPGNGSNGGQFGYSVAGGSDAENSYLVEGQETANLIGGYSHTNVPFDFIEEVQVKTSGVVAEYGGALGGVVNVVMKKGTPRYHGSIFAQFENQAMDAGPSPTTLYDATSSETAQPGWKSSGSASYAGFSDATYQAYQPKQSHASDFLPGFTLGGPLLPFSSNLREKVFFFAGFQPELQRVARKIDYSSAANANTSVDPTLGVVPFSRNTNTYYTTARIDAQATKKIHVFGSWLYQLQRQNGEAMPRNDSTRGQANLDAGNLPSTYAHTLGFVAPNITFNTGADITLTSHIVSTTRFGYYFENYHDFGYPTGGVEWQFQNNTVGGADANGKTLPASLQASQNQTNTAINSNETHYNANKAIQLDQAFSFYKSGWAGTHNFKVGYQLNRLSNNILQGYNQPYFQVFAGSGAAAQYSTLSPVGDANCAAFNTKYGACQGQYGYIVLFDFGTGGKATSFNHSIFVQDSWTIGHGVTLDLGVRVEKEFLPGEAVAGGAPAKPINFGWGDKVAPRLGAAWDVLRNGKMKLFGSYGVFNDQMKLNLAISSFGGQYWNNCAYALDTSNLSSINVAYDANNRYCSGFDSTLPGHFAGSTPAGLTFLENINNRAFPTTCSTCSESQEGVAPGLKPYRQHEAVFGWDYQLARNVAFEARYDRRRLDHVIEDASIYNPQLGGETFVIVNPGQGTNGSFSGFCNFLYPTSQGFTNCLSSTGKNPPDKNIPAARSYDGVEFRLSKAMSQHWAGLFSYTYSSFRGNYTGLTSSDQADAGGGRNSPNNSRAFDEPYFQYDANGNSSSGPLPTDRPNTLKGYVYYQLGFLKSFTTNLGIFQTLYEGSPNSSILDAGAGSGAWLVYPVGRGGWVDVSQNPSTGAITLGTPRVYRTPWYNQTDFSFKQDYRMFEGKTLSFSSTFSNLLNQHTVTSFVEQVDTGYSSNYIRPGNLNITGGVPFYAAAESAYNVTALINGTVAKSNNKSGPLTINSQYGQPNTYQLPRTIRLQASFTF
jgi:hypothetical protein